jgi:hypothetical protein
VGRHQIIGNEYCPTPTCQSLSLGRYMAKNVRNRTSGRYTKRYYYQHNDKNVRQHYVDSYVRKMQNSLLQKHPLSEIIKSLTLLGNDFNKSVFLSQKIIKQVRNFPLTDNEVSELNNYFKQKSEMVKAIENIMKLLIFGMMLRIQGKEIPEWLHVEEQRLIDLSNKLGERLTMTDVANIVKSDPLYSVYEKYEFPNRLQRYKDANKMNSRWN